MRVKKTEIEKYIKKGAQISRTITVNRGIIMEFASDVENELTNIITWCFYPARYNVKSLPNELLDENGIIFKSLILTKIDFCDKINMLKEVILAKKPNILGSHHRLVKDIKNHLDEVRDFRNLMAHCSSDMSHGYINSIALSNFEKNKEFQILEYKKGKLIKRNIKQNKIEYEIWKSIRTSLELQQLFALINEDEQTYKDNEELVIRINNMLRTYSKS